MLVKTSLGILVLGASSKGVPFPDPPHSRISSYNNPLAICVVVEPPKVAPDPGPSINAILMTDCQSCNRDSDAVSYEGYGTMGARGGGRQ